MRRRALTLWAGQQVLALGVGGAAGAAAGGWSWGRSRFCLWFQKRRSSRQVKRKRYTEDLEFRISEEDDSGDDSSAPKSPSSSSQLQVRAGGGGGAAGARAPLGPPHSGGELPLL